MKTFWKAYARILAILTNNNVFFSKLIFVYASFYKGWTVWILIRVVGGDWMEMLRIWFGWEYKFLSRSTHSPIQPDRLDIIYFWKYVLLCIRRTTFTISEATQLELTVFFLKIVLEKFKLKVFDHWIWE